MINRFYRWLPDFKGKQRLGRLIFRKQIKNAKDIIVLGNQGLKYLLPNLNENIGYEIFINGVYEKKTSEFIISKIPTNGIYIDIGANIGSIALPILLARKDIKAICIEASQTVFSYLKKNVILNNIKNIILVNKAISNKNKEQVNFYSPKNQFGKGHFSNVIINEIEAVSTIKLDTLLNEYNIFKPNFIKIDIEGYEYYAFKGAEKILESENAPDILFEFENWAEARAEGLKPGDAQNYLLQKGYRLFVLDKDKLEAIKLPILKGSFMIWATKGKE